MISIIHFWDSRKNLLAVTCVGLFFGLYLLLGLSIYKDYGISTDEDLSFTRGQVNYQRMTGKITEAQFLKACKNSVCFYPPFFEIILYGVAHSGSDQAIFQTRHLVTFLYFFIAVFFFFLIGKIVFKDWKLGLLGALFLIISPRIFAHSFYNPKDIPFLSSYIIAMFSLLMYLRKRNLLWAVLHGAATGMAGNIRTPGIVLLAITFLFVAADLLLSKASRREILKAALAFSVYVGTALAVIYATFPTLYVNPIANYIKTFNIMKQFPWIGYQLYLGQDISNQIPWHYSLVWFAVSSPLFYVALFLLGLAGLLVNFYRTNREGRIAQRDMYVVLVCGLLPVGMVIVMKSVLYNDNRQMYFCYPAMLIVAVYGFTMLVRLIQRFIKTPAYQRAAVLAVLVLGLAEPTSFMLQNHPFENVYFNILAGPSMSVVKERFGLDTWLLSARQGYEYILRTDSRKNIKIAYAWGIDPKTGKLILHATSKNKVSFLPQVDADRIKLTSSNPDYMIDLYRFYPKWQVSLPANQRVFSIRVGDADIMTVYKLH